MLNLPPEDDDDYEILEHANSLIESKNFDIFEWHQLLANADWDWSVEQLKIIESHLKSRLGDIEYSKFIISNCTLCDDGYDTHILSYVCSEIKEKKESKEFIKLFKDIVVEKIQEENEEVLWALMRAWKLEDEEKGRVLFESLDQDFQSFLKEDAEIDGVYIG